MSNKIIEMSFQDSIRNSLIKLIDKEGINQKHIATVTGIIESNLSRFKKNTLNLKYSDLDKLNSYLQSKGY